MQPEVLMKSRAFILAAALVAATFAAPARAAEPSWQSWNAGLQQAAQSRRPVLVDVYTDWCGWCKRMDRDVYSRADVREYLSQHFVIIKLDAESGEGATYGGERTSSRGIAMRFGVSGYPTTIFLRSNGEHLANVPGYVPAERFLSLLRYIGDGHMDRGESYDDFVASSKR
jgi:thioredoxin-related protein